MKDSTGALVKAGADLIARGALLLGEISDAGNKPGGPTMEDVQRVRAAYNISDDTLHDLLTGGPG